jgi:hypothetical protein
MDYNASSKAFHLHVEVACHALHCKTQLRILRFPSDRSFADVSLPDNLSEDIAVREPGHPRSRRRTRLYEVARSAQFEALEKKFIEDQMSVLQLCEDDF